MKALKSLSGIMNCYTNHFLINIIVFKGFSQLELAIDLTYVLILNTESYHCWIVFADIIIRVSNMQQI